MGIDPSPLRYTRCGHDYKWLKAKGGFLTMGTKRVGLARTEALIENLKRTLTFTGATLSGGTISGTGVSNCIIESDQQCTISGNVRFTGSTPVHMHQVAPEALADDTAIIAKGMFKKRLMTINAGDARSKATDTAANIVDECALDSDGDSFDIAIINTNTTTDHILTITAGSGVTLVGDMLCYPYVTGEDTSGSAMFRVRRTGASAVTIYRLA